MSRKPRLAASTASLAGLLLLAGCGGSSSGAVTTAAVDPTAAALQDQLDVLPQIDGAERTRHDLTGSTLTESFTVPGGAPACLQLLARLDAGGYEVVAGPGRTAVDPATCRTADADPGVDTSAGTATVLARGGSEIALTWTTTTYTLVVTAAG